jgi:transcriptional regulator
VTIARLDMTESSTDVIQGTLDMLVLKSLSLQPMHGFGIAQRIEQISRGVFKVNPGSLMLAFQRMEREALIEPEWRTTDNGRRAKYYRITAKGRRHLEREARDWDRRATAIARLLEA